MVKKKARLPKLPQLLDRKIYKTGQTRGADDDVIYQNRVFRSSTVLIPYSIWNNTDVFLDGKVVFENDFIVLISPCVYFNNKNIEQELKQKNLELGKNALVFYQQRTDWDNINPEDMNWKEATSRKSPLNGQYVARIAATTALSNGVKISRGYNTTGMKGAGIRLYEYASKEQTEKCRTQLEAIFWFCEDAIDAVTEFGMTVEDANTRKTGCFKKAKEAGLLDDKKLQDARIINESKVTICPLCLEPLSGFGFFSRLVQALGREVHDLTVTEVNLFHIRELQYGEFNHKPYNLGWGHHHCNVVVKDSGINQTVEWMNNVVERNIEQGYFIRKNDDS